jgi:DNA-directed RNA polymerase specialized sigma24 family protein
MSHSLLPSPSHVAWALITYTDWWQPSTSSVYRIGGRGRRLAEGINPRVLDGLALRSELCRRMDALDERDRHLLFLWYVRQLAVDDIARELGISRRQCFRLRARAIRTLVDPEAPAA